MNKNNNSAIAYVCGILTAFDSYFIVKNAVDWANKDAFVKQQKACSVESELSDKVRTYIKQVEKEANSAKWQGLLNVLGAGAFGTLTIIYALKSTEKEESYKKSD